MSLLRNAICLVQKSPCGHVTAQKCYFLGTKKAPVGMLLLRFLFWYNKAPAGMLLLRNAICLVQKSPCGHVTAQKCIF